MKITQRNVHTTYQIIFIILCIKQVITSITMILGNLMCIGYFNADILEHSFIVSEGQIYRMFSFYLLAYNYIATTIKFISRMPVLPVHHDNCLQSGFPAAEARKLLQLEHSTFWILVCKVMSCCSGRTVGGDA